MRDALRLGIAVVLVAMVGCGGASEVEAPEGCPPDSFLSYTNFGQPFMANWCTGCHSSQLGVSERAGAPEGIDFDTPESVAAHLPRIEARATGGDATMPPIGGPSTEERELLLEWMTCGAP